MIPLLLIMVVALFWRNKNNNTWHCTEMVRPGTIIILNGPSAAGKTTLQKELQAKLSSFYVNVGIDSLFDAVLPSAIGESMKEVSLENLSYNELFPKGITNEEKLRITKVYEQRSNNNELIRAGVYTTDSAGNPLLILRIGKQGEAVIKGMHRAIAAYAKAGNNVIVDYILYEQEWINDLICVLQDFTVYFVGVTIPLEILEQREKDRGTSPVGHARSHYYTVHEPGLYDLEVDTGSLTSQQAAEIIKEFVESDTKPSAFNQIKVKNFHDVNGENSEKR